MILCISYMQFKDNSNEYTCKTETNGFRGSPGGSCIKNLPANAGDLGSILGQDEPLEKEMATHSSILACRIPWTGKPGRLQSTGSQTVGRDLATTHTEETDADVVTCHSQHLSESRSVVSDSLRTHGHTAIGHISGRRRRSPGSPFYMSSLLIFSWQRSVVL